MKKSVLLLTLALSLASSTVCMAAETNTAFALRPDSEITYSEAADSEAADEAAAPDQITNPAVGAWEQKGMDGEWMAMPGPSYTYYIYPDGTAANSDDSLQLPVLLSDDGSFTIDTSGSEELADYTVTGRVSPISQESLDRFKVDKGSGYVNYSDVSTQMILTISYPDPKNPLASSPSVTNVYFLRKNNQASLIKNYITDKVWKTGDNILKMSADGLLDLNSGESTGTYSVYENKDESLYLTAQVVFRWDEGGVVKYAPVMLSENAIHLQNISKPEETLVLECIKDMSVPDPADVKPFTGKWKIAEILKNNTEINAADLLECDSMTAEVLQDGSITLAFSNGFSSSLKPVYEDNMLKVRYTNGVHYMNWEAVPEDDGTVTAVYDDYRITFEKVQ